MENTCWTSKGPFVWNYRKGLNLVNSGSSKHSNKNLTLQRFFTELGSVEQEKGGKNGLPWLTTNISAFHDCTMEAKIAFNRMRSWTQQQWNKPSHHATKCEMSEGLQMLLLYIRSTTKVFSCTKRLIDEGFEGVFVCVWKRYLTEKFQRLSANTSSLEERGEVFLCMCALLKIPRRVRGGDNAV